VTDGKDDDDDQRDLFGPPSPFDHFDLGAGRAGRDKGMARVDRHGATWTRRARTVITNSLPIGWEGRAEELRALLCAAGMPDPHHHNCWGSLIHWLVKSGVLTATGDHEQMRDPRSHARQTPVYRRLNGVGR